MPKLLLVEALEASFDSGAVDTTAELLEGIEALRSGECPPLLEAHAHRFRAKLGGGEARFRAASALFREHSLTFWLAVTLLEQGELTGDESLLSEARAIFERLEAKPWLARLERVEPEAAVPA
jgi:hypothetical protein